MARISKKEIVARMESYRREYGFTDEVGWSQVERDLVPPTSSEAKMPRAVAYGAYMELVNLLDD